jgi:ferritin-like metal-binding protein YciE
MHRAAVGLWGVGGRLASAGSGAYAALIAAAQKVEHHEIAAYGSLCAIGKQLGFTEGVNLLKETLEEERATDLKLTESAERDGNVKAKAA